MRGRGLSILSVLAVGLIVLASTPLRAFAGEVDDAVLAELNFARTHPSEYARELQGEGGFDSPGARISAFADEDPRALREAIDFLRRQRPLRPLSQDARLAASAIAHAAAQEPGGEVGHVDPDGTNFEQRLHRSGVWPDRAAEAIFYGYATPRDVVRRLIVDSGVADRGHRRNIFDPAFQFAGVGCGDHATYGFMCVIDFAGGPAPLK